MRTLGRIVATLVAAATACGGTGGAALPIQLPTLVPVPIARPAPALARSDRLPFSPDALTLIDAAQGAAELAALPPRRIDFDLAFGLFPKVVATRAALLREDGAPQQPPVSFDSVKVPHRIVHTILRAAAVTGADPVYLMALADQESGFRPSVQSPTSSAAGMFQFVDRTWLKLIKEFGAKYGLADLAAAITFKDGEPAVGDAVLRRHILALREEPYLAAIMAGELAKRDGKILAGVIGRAPSNAESYLAHFFGVVDATQFVELLKQTPKRAASAEFPAAASANRALFYSHAGKRARALSITQVFKKIDGMVSRRVQRYRGLERPETATAFAAEQRF